MAVTQAKKGREIISLRNLLIAIRVRNIHHGDQSITTRKLNPELRQPVSLQRQLEGCPIGLRAPGLMIRGRSCHLRMCHVAASTGPSASHILVSKSICLTDFTSRVQILLGHSCLNSKLFFLGFLASCIFAFDITCLCDLCLEIVRSSILSDHSLQIEWSPISCNPYLEICVIIYSVRSLPGNLFDRLFVRSIPGIWIAYMVIVVTNLSFYFFPCASISALCVFINIIVISCTYKFFCVGTWTK